MTKYVYDFSEGNKDMKDLLGGKGANLAEMTRMGLPVPPGFTITTEACLTFLREGGAPAEMRKKLTALMDEGLTDRQIYERLRKDHGGDLVRPHLLP